MTQKEKSYYFHFHKDDVTWPFSVSPVSGALSHGKWIFSRLFSAGNLLQSHVGQVCLMHNHSHARLSFQFVSYIKFSQWCHFTTATRIPLLSFSLKCTMHQSHWHKNYKKSPIVTWINIWNKNTNWKNIHFS